jgi:hypothetical protein
MKKYTLTIDSYEEGMIQRDSEPLSVSEAELFEHIKFHIQRGVPLQITIDGEHVIEELIGKSNPHLDITFPRKNRLN